MEESHEESTQSGETQEYVDTHEAADEDLEAFLANATEEDPTEAPEEVAAPEPEQKEKPELPEPQKDPAAVSREEFEKLAKQLQGQELLIKRRTSEIGELKKHVAQFKFEKEQLVDEQWQVDPKQAYKTQQQIDQAANALTNLQAEEETIVTASQTQQLLATHIGPEVDFVSMVESLRSDGMPEEYIQQFINNPYTSMLPETALQLAKRGSAEKKARELESYLYQVVPLLQNLMQQQKQTPNDVAKNIANTLRQSPSITASSGGTGQSSKPRTADPTLMSDVELEEFLRN